jgi:hypothetical protein
VTVIWLEETLVVKELLFEITLAKLAAVFGELEESMTYSETLSPRFEAAIKE